MVADVVKNTPDKNNDCKNRNETTQDTPRWNCLLNSGTKVNELFCCVKVGHSVLFYVILVLILLFFVYVIRKLVSLPVVSSKYSSRKLTNNTNVTPRNESSGTLGKTRPIKWPAIRKIVAHLDAYSHETESEQTHNSITDLVTQKPFGSLHQTTSIKPQQSVDNYNGQSPEPTSYRPQNENNNVYIKSFIPKISPTEAPHPNIADASGNLEKSWYSGDFKKDPSFQNSPTISPTISHYTVSENNGFENFYNDWSAWNHPEALTSGQTASNNFPWTYSGFGNSQSGPPVSTSYTGSNFHQARRPNIDRAGDNSQNQNQNLQISNSQGNDWSKGQTGYNNLPWSTFGSGWPTENGFGWIRSDGHDSITSFPSYSSGSSGTQLPFDGPSSKLSFSGYNAGENYRGENYQAAQPSYLSHPHRLGSNSWNPNYNYEKKNETNDQKNKFVTSNPNHGGSTAEHNGNLKDLEYNLKSWAVDNRNNDDKTNKAVYKWPSHPKAKKRYRSKISKKVKYGKGKLLKTWKQKHKNDKAENVKKSNIPRQTVEKLKANPTESQYIPTHQKPYSHTKIPKKLSSHKHTHPLRLSYESYTKLKKRNRFSETLVGKWKRKNHRVKKCKLLSSFTADGKVTLKSRYSNQKYKYTLLSCTSVGNAYNRDYKKNKKYKRQVGANNLVCRESWFITTGKIILKKVIGKHRKNKYFLQLCNRNHVDASNSPPIENDQYSNEMYDSNIDKDVSNNGRRTEKTNNVENDNEDTSNTDSSDDDLDLETDDEGLTTDNKLTKQSNTVNVKDNDDDDNNSDKLDDLNLRTDNNKQNDNDDGNDNGDGVDDDAGEKQSKHFKNRKNDYGSNANQDNKDNEDDDDDENNSASGVIPGNEDNNDDIDDNEVSDDKAGKDNDEGGKKRSNKNRINDHTSNSNLDVDDFMDKSDIKSDSDNDGNKNDSPQDYINTKQSKPIQNSHKAKRRKINRHNTRKQKLTKNAIKTKAKKQLVHHVKDDIGHSDKTDDSVYKDMLEEIIKKYKNKNGNEDLLETIATLSRQKAAVNTRSKKLTKKYPTEFSKKFVRHKKKRQKTKSKRPNNSEKMSTQAIQLSATKNELNDVSKIPYNSNNPPNFIQDIIKKSHAPKMKSSELDLKGLLRTLFPSALKQSTVISTTPAPIPSPTTPIHLAKKTPSTKERVLTPENFLNLLSTRNLGVKNPVKTEQNGIKESQEATTNSPKTGPALANRIENQNLLTQQGTFDKSKLNTNLQEDGEIQTKESLRSYIPNPKPVQPTLLPTVRPLPQPSDTPSIYTNQFQNTVSKPNARTSNGFMGYSRYLARNSNLDTYAAPAINILCFGDSLTSGYYNHGKGKHPYSIRLSQILNSDGNHRFSIVTRGVVGEMAHGSMTKRLPKVLNEGTHFDWVLILGGTNDVAHVKNFGDDDDFTQQLISVWSPKIVKDIEKLHQTAHNYGAKTILMTIPETAYELSPEFRAIRNMRLSVNAAIRTYATQVKDTTVLCDLAIKLPRSALSKELQRLYWNDHIHLNPIGYNKMAEIIAQCIKPYLTK